jgi:hypothetical protein
MEPADVVTLRSGLPHQTFEHEHEDEHEKILTKLVDLPRKTQIHPYLPAGLSKPGLPAFSCSPFARSALAFCISPTC